MHCHRAILAAHRPRPAGHCERWLRELRAQRAEGEPHLPLVMMLLGTKADLRRRRAVVAQDAKEFAQRHRLLYAECSSSDASEVCLR